MKVGLFVTCLADAMRPQVAVSALHLLRQAGVSPLYPPLQTCCGQIALNGGYRKEAAFFARKCAEEFAACDKVVFPSASCCSVFRRPLLGGDKNSATQGGPATDDGLSATERERIVHFRAKCVELSEFLQETGFVPQKPKTPPLSVVFHDCCSGLRDLGIKTVPRKFLRAAGITVLEMPDGEECCGFGGVFATKFAELSVAIGDKKCAQLIAANADAAVMGDLGCMLHIEGILRRRQSNLPVRHWAEILAPAA